MASIEESAIDSAVIDVADSDLKKRESEGDETKAIETVEDREK